MERGPRHAEPSEVSDIERIRILHDLSSFFKIDEATIGLLKQQLDPSLRDQIGRFFQGYSTEQSFRLLFAFLPWVKMIHGLAQLQIPRESKTVYQVPDYAALCETYTRTDKPLLVETKRVKKNKQSLEVMAKQFEAVEKYADVLGLPLVFATYWESFSAWTVNTPDAFVKKGNSYRLRIEGAIETDCSLVFGDISFLIDKPMLRKTVCDASITDPDKARHEKYGAMVDDFISMDGSNYIHLEPIESAVIDSVVTMKEMSKTQNSSITELHEESRSPQVVKFSTFITRHLALFGMKLDEKLTDLSARIIWRLMERLGIRRVLILPALDRPKTRKLAEEFLGTAFVGGKL